MGSAESVSLIVPVHNGGEGWSRVLDALAALDPAPGEIVIVDDGSTDRSAELARARRFKVLATPRAQSGPAVARNVGAAQTAGELLFFVDADILLYPDAAARVSAAFSDPAVSAAFGSYDDAPADPAFISQFKNLTHHYVHQTSRGEATSFWAGCGAIRREAFRQLGGFSGRYVRPSIEDIELGYRLRRAGGHTRLLHDLQVKHLKRWTLRSLLVTDIRDRALPWAKLMVEEQELPADLNLQWSHRVSALGCWLLLLSTVVIPWLPLSAFVALFLVVVLLALNFDLYRFYYDKRGLGFLLGALPVHWLYYLYSSAAFGWVLLKGILSSRVSAQDSGQAVIQNHSR